MNAEGARERDERETERERERHRERARERERRREELLERRETRHSRNIIDKTVNDRSV